jgi:hypothetical protein
MEWKFAQLSDLMDRVGFKDNDIEKFGLDPAKSIVREAIQNSCDALDIDNGKTQVKVVIKKGEVAKDLLPNFVEIEQHLRTCIALTSDPSEIQEIERHLAAIEADAYSYLEISDYNTMGMGQAPFESLTQGIFKSTKFNTGSQGSKGVGKAAYYASSYLRTMLISTLNHEGNRFRGVAKISSHYSLKAPIEKLNYKGFYGGVELVDNTDIPVLFQRSELGTSIFVMGLWPSPGLDEEIICEVLRNYWFAIYKEQLVVSVNDIEINATNIEQYVTHYFTDYKDYKTGDKQNPRPFLETVKQGKEYKKTIAHIGECSLWLSKNDAFNLGAVARFRKTKMLIYKENDLDVGFAGVFLCDNDEGNVFLKEIENDAHDIWSEKINKNKKDEARVTLSEIKEFIRESYVDYSGMSGKSSFTVDAIDSLFNFSGGGRKTKRKTAPKPDTDLDPDPVPDDTGGDPDGTRKPHNRVRRIDSAKFKAHVDPADNSIYYSLHITGTSNSGVQRFRIHIGTDSSKEAINIISSSGGQLNDNVLTLDISRIKVVDRIVLDSTFLVAPYLVSIID